jgi:hypothetical protein
MEDLVRYNREGVGSTIKKRYLEHAESLIVLFALVMSRQGIWAEIRYGTEPS